MNTPQLFFGILSLVVSLSTGLPLDNSIPTNNNDKRNASVYNHQNDDITIHLPHKPDYHHCFPSDAYLRRDDGVQIQMKDITIGDKVMTINDNGHMMYSEIIMMLHRDNEKTLTDYIKVTTKCGVKLTLSKYHLIALSSSDFIFGKDVRPGQNLTVYSNKEKYFHSSEVITVEHVTKVGVHAPLSKEGTLVVNDVYVSCYASFPSHWISHAMFSIWRGLYDNFPSALSSSTNSNNIHWYPGALMSAAGFFNLLSV